MRKVLSRAARAALLDRKAFTEAFFDNDAPADAAIVVASVGALTYLGWWGRGLARFSMFGLFESLIGSVVSWLVLAFGAWFAASRLFRSTGRAQTMIALQGLAALPLLLEAAGGLFAAAGLVWYLAALTVGTMEAADLPTKEAAVSVLIGLALAAIARSLAGAPFVVLGGLLG